MTAGIEIINHSGIDWAYWERRWKDFSIDVRESTVKREILPLLSGEHRAARAEIPLSTGTAPAKETVTKEQIEKIRKDIEEKITLPIAASATAPAQKQNENLLENDDDMRILVNPERPILGVYQEERQSESCLEGVNLEELHNHTMNFFGHFHR